MEIRGPFRVAYYACFDGVAPRPVVAVNIAPPRSSMRRLAAPSEPGRAKHHSKHVQPSGLRRVRMRWTDAWRP